MHSTQVFQTYRLVCLFKCPERFSVEAIRIINDDLLSGGLLVIRCLRLETDIMASSLFMKTGEWGQNLHQICVKEFRTICLFLTIVFCIELVALELKDA